MDGNLPRARLMLGEALTNAGRMPEAIEELQAYVATHPESAEGFFRLGQAYFHLQEYEQARAAQERAIQASPEFAAAYHTLANACTALGQAEQAERYRQDFTRLSQGRQEANTKERGGVNDIDLGRSNLAEAHLVAARTYETASGAYGDPSSPRGRTALAGGRPRGPGQS